MPKISNLNQGLKEQLFDVFCYYVPNKERAFIINRIADCYGIDKSLSSLLETGLELIFAAYYLRDDLLDDAPTILGQSVNGSSAKYFSLLADMLDEIGNMQIAEYCARQDSCFEHHGSVFNGFLLLSYGQLQGLRGAGKSVEEYLDIAYNKNGAMMEYAIKMLLPFLPRSDGEHLLDYATSFGVASQIRNDIEDFLSKDTDFLFHDLRMRQANFVLSAHYDRTGAACDCGLNESLDIDVYSVLAPDICFSIKFLYAFKDTMLKTLGLLHNTQCKDYLNEITNIVISLK